MQKQVISRDEAYEKRLKRYYTGVLCTRGHDAERYTSNGACIACMLRTVSPPEKPELFRYLPHDAYVFDAPDIGKPASMIEAQAVFRWMHAAKWHIQALKLLRLDPALMARFNHEMTFEEKCATGRMTPDPTPTVKSTG